MWPAIAMGVATMASKFASSAASRRHNDRQLQSQRNYNDPSAMMERYRRAGLNPYQDLGANGVGMSELGTPTTPDDYGSSAVNDGINSAFSAMDSSLNFQRKKIDNDQAQFDLQFKKDLENVRKELEKSSLSTAKYNRDVAQMARNATLYTFQDNLLNTFLNYDWVNAQLSNGIAMMRQQNNALGRTLGYNVSDYDYIYGLREATGSRSQFDPLGGSYQNDYKVPEHFRSDQWELFSFMNKGSKDRNNPLYQYFKQNYSNMLYESCLHTQQLLGAKDAVKYENSAMLYEAMSNAADRQFDYACRNGFKNVDKNMLMYNGMKIVGGWIDGFVGSASSAYGSYLSSKSGHLKMQSTDWNNKFEYQAREHDFRRSIK